MCSSTTCTIYGTCCTTRGRMLWLIERERDSV